ncbi:MAG: 50S ribosomal protein L19e [Thermoplasmata archaeon]|nr:50S ribosomal protein L19e [Thermoplasmata archaeon]
MTDISIQKRLAAEVMKCGIKRVWIADRTDALEKVEDAVTRDDIKELIAMNVIQKKQKKGVSRGRARAMAEQKRKGKRRGHGSRKGRTKARSPKKRAWINTIRPIREELRTLREEGKMDRTAYRKYYMRAKGGMFRSRAHLRSHLISDGVIREE